MKYPSIRIEGAILSADILDKIEQGDLLGQKPKDFGFDGSNVRVKDEIVKAWADAQDMWRIYHRKMENVSEHRAGTTETRNFWMVPLLGLLGYEVELYRRAQEIHGKTYAISHKANNIDNFPIHIMGFRDSLDKKRQDSGPRMSPHALVQEYINLNEHLYALVSNGLTLRLLRDSSRLIKLSFVEFDLERMFEEEHFADFALMFRLIHCSRMPPKQTEGPESLIEGYHQDSLDSGSRIRDGLSKAVETSIKSVANGFLSHPENKELRQAIISGDLTAKEFFKYQLRFIYRLLFLMVIEERDLIFTKDTPRKKKDIYYNYYSVSRIRKLSEKRYLADRKFSDVWISLKNTFRLFEKKYYGEKLDIKPLDGDLFNANAIGLLNRCQLNNKVMLECLANLSVFTNPETQQKMRVNYASLNVEEFGSVYEGLLEYDPVLDIDGGKVDFHLVKGTERSSSGSHYTPDELVQPLIKHSLDYIIEEKLVSSKGVSREIAHSEVESSEEANRGLANSEIVNSEVANSGIVNRAFTRKEILLILGENGEEDTLLPGPSGVAKSHGSGGNRLYGDQMISQGRSLRDDQSDKEKCQFDPRQYRRRLGEKLYQRISSFFEDRSGQPQRTGNASSSLHKSQVDRPESMSGNVSHDRRNWENAAITYIQSQKPKTIVKLLPDTIRYSILANRSLLSITVCDVACGSGHFLLGAARRIATELAKVRSGEDQPSPSAFREAVRDVIRHCIYGVDINPLAVELAKVALWLEAHNPGEPLNFLDHKIKCGDAIVGLAHLDELENGIANEAFKKLPGDDDIARTLAKRNREEKKTKQVGLDFDRQVGQKIDEVAAAYAHFNQMPESTPDEIRAKQQAYQRLGSGANWWKLKTLADIQTAQFFIPKTVEHRDHLMTEATYRDMLIGTKSLQGSRAVAKANAVASEKRFFHWFLEFPEIFAGRSEVGSSEIGNSEVANSEVANSEVANSKSNRYSLLTTRSMGFDCILGNPPFLGGKKISSNFGLDYVNWIKFNYPTIGSSDLVGYFFRRIFTIIRNNRFQSLIATNTIGQGDTRKVGLEQILNSGGTINYAIRSMRWPGLAAVVVAQVTIYKGKWTKEFVLDNRQVKQITSYLDDSEEIGNPFKLAQNKLKSFIGTFVLGKGFVLEPKEANRLLTQNPKNKNVIFPYLNGQDLNSRPDQSPSRYIINFFDWEEDYCKNNYPECWNILVERVKPQRDEIVAKGNQIHEYCFWKYWDRRPELYRTIAPLEGVLVVARISRTLAFEIIDSKKVFADAIVVFAYSYSYYFSVLQSSIHNHWAWKYCTTMKTDLNYTPGNTFETFLFPQNLSTETEAELEKIGETYHEFRRQLMLKMQLGLTKTYNQFHNPQLSSEIANSEAVSRKELEKKYGKETVNLWNHLQKTVRQAHCDTSNVCSMEQAVNDIKHLRQLHKEMDEAVLRAYGWYEDSEKGGPAIDLAHDFYDVDYLPENDRVRYTISPEARKEVLKRLLLLNHEIYEEEVKQGLHGKKSGKKKPLGVSEQKTKYNPNQGALFATPEAPQTSHTGDGFRVGQKVNHPVFGHGVIKAMEGSGDDVRLTIQFDEGGKKLMAKFAKLEVV